MKYNIKMIVNIEMRNEGKTEEIAYMAKEDIT